MTGGIMRARPSWLPRPILVASLAATLLMLSEGLPVVHATIPYYPYECPIGSGGTDFHGLNGINQGEMVLLWDPGTVSGSRPTRALILFGDVGRHSGAGRLQW